ncbi:hypothetical protein [Streptococcus equi]|uniref:hypothetical protein n=1 Tax=Streptococcus equi TaxID=1336 RepID=UPI000E03E3F1|nr:hypothetical protein [Streptococcus equi]SUN69721.1 Uncharacterised protein [Streptococcus equi subsp. zooepidemicus]SUN69725.1 Uncharacterised protein [Streptococcus equi subsp. zooepidemicus]HEL1022747.1 hypothetical protein [Streptococcus equi subsp. zooepidemicus]HEL1089779.1 hypothetical protein [Streptococcus equi subsp. zooepidemicus]
MIAFIPETSPLNSLTLHREGYEPILYTLDELKSSVDASLDNNRYATVVLYSEKMSPMFFGYATRTKNGKVKVITEYEFLNAPRS